MSKSEHNPVSTYALWEVEGVRKMTILEDNPETLSVVRIELDNGWGLMVIQGYLLGPVRPKCHIYPVKYHKPTNNWRRHWGVTPPDEPDIGYSEQEIVNCLKILANEEFPY